MQRGQKAALFDPRTSSKQAGKALLREAAAENGFSQLPPKVRSTRSSHPMLATPTSAQVGFPCAVLSVAEK